MFGKRGKGKGKGSAGDWEGLEGVAESGGEGEWREMVVV